MKCESKQNCKMNPKKQRRAGSKTQAVASQKMGPKKTGSK